MVLFYMPNEHAQFLKECCGSDNTKYILAGIHFEVEPEGEAIAVSIDGRRCAVVEIVDKIPKKYRELLNDLVILPPKKLDKKSRVGLRYDEENKKFQWHIENKDGAWYDAESIKGKFPKWRQFLKSDGGPHFRCKFDSGLVPSGFKYEWEFSAPHAPIFSNHIFKGDDKVEGLKFFFMPMKPMLDGIEHGVSVEGIVHSIEKLDEKGLAKVRKALEKAEKGVA